MMTFDDSRITVPMLTNDIEVQAELAAARGAVMELAHQVVELHEQMATSAGLLRQVITALSAVGCLDQGALRPCDICWPCIARRGLLPIPVH
jgi:hypothetical protein